MKLGDKVKYNDTICTVVGLHKKTDEIIVTYKDGWIFDESLSSLLDTFTTKGVKFGKSYHFTNSLYALPSKNLKKEIKKNMKHYAIERTETNYKELNKYFNKYIDPSCSGLSCQYDYIRFDLIDNKFQNICGGSLRTGFKELNSLTQVKALLKRKLRII